MSMAEQIKKGMALAFFASAYADMAEECDEPLRGEIMDQLPDEAGEIISVPYVEFGSHSLIIDYFR